MTKIIAHCGLNCSECNAYIATANDHQELREQTAKEWSEMYSADIKAEHINCMGCQSDVNFGHCSVCEIRACAVAKGVENCGHCPDYGCDIISSFFEMVPDAKQNLEEIRNK